MKDENLFYLGLFALNMMVLLVMSIHVNTELDAYSEALPLEVKERCQIAREMCEHGVRLMNSTQGNWGQSWPSSENYWELRND